MEGGAAGDPRGLRGQPPAGTFLVPRRLRALGSPPGAVPVSQPVLILQQLPGPGAAPAGPPPVRGDLMELMLIQSSQMHQLLMHGLAVAALAPLSVGPAPAPAQGSDRSERLLTGVLVPSAALPHSSGSSRRRFASVPPQALTGPFQGEEEEEAVVFHHHYIPWAAPGPGPVRFLCSSPGDKGALPPPPPPSATGTVGPGVPPAAEYYSAEERGL
ncbi:proline-rich protein 29 isoform X2 [Prinia subflava]|uniref:proline-rich protein 29 isoform X2 n=1 Tax=Prinia subflava TaxID=208062 RepID=UPI002FE13DBE